MTFLVVAPFHCISLSAFGDLEDFRRDALVGTCDQFHEPRLAVAFAGCRNTLHAGVVQTLLLRTLLHTVGTDAVQRIDNIFFISLIETRFFKSSSTGDYKKM